MTSVENGARSWAEWFTRWGAIVQTLSVMVSAAYFVFYGGYRLAIIEAKVTAIAAAMQINREEHAVIFNHMQSGAARDAEQDVRLNALQEAIRQLPPDWLRDQVRQMDARIRDLERGEATEPRHRNN